MKATGVALLLGIVLVLVHGCGNAPAKSTRMEVCASLFPVAEWAREVVGPDATVHLLEGAGGGPHTFSPSMQDIVLIGRAKALLVIGLGLDPWALRAVAGSSAGGGVELLEVGTWVLRRKMGGGGHAHEDHAHHEHAHAHPESGEDPHVWLDPERAAKIVVRMGEEFARLDATHAEGYRARAKAYAAKLVALAQELDTQGQSLKGKQLITQHDAYGYLFERFGVTLAGVIQVSPNLEPSAKDVSEAVRRMKELGQKVVFSEPGREASSQVLAETLGGKVVVLDNLEMRTSPYGTSYAERLKHNVKMLVENLP